jgi:hypothetical protein
MAGDQRFSRADVDPSAPAFQQAAGSTAAGDSDSMRGGLHGREDAPSGAAPPTATRGNTCREPSGNGPHYGCRVGPLKPRPPASLKRVVALSVELAGGNKAAAAMCGCAPSVMAKYGDHAVPQSRLPIDHALKLDRFAVGQARRPMIMDFLAFELGYAVMPLAGPLSMTGANPRPVACDLAAIGKESGDLFQRVGEALADGHVCGADAQRLLQEVYDLMSVASTAAAGLRALIEASPAVGSKTGRPGCSHAK